MEEEVRFCRLKEGAGLVKTERKKVSRRDGAKIKIQKKSNGKRRNIDLVRVFQLIPNVIPVPFYMLI